MRYLWLCFMLCVCSAAAHADTTADTDSAVSVGADTALTVANDPYTNFDYKQTREWKRYKVLRAVGWSAVGVSVPTLLIGTGLGYLTDGGQGPAEWTDNTASTSLFITGGVLLASGIAMLVTAYDYRSKAKRMAVSLSAINTPSPTGHGLAYTPALSFSLTF